MDQVHDVHKDPRTVISSLVLPLPGLSNSPREVGLGVRVGFQVRKQTLHPLLFMALETPGMDI